MKYTITLVRRRIFLVMAIALLGWGCDKGKGEVDQFLQSQPQNTERPGSFATPLAPGVSTEASLLVDEFWTIEYYVNPDDMTRNIKSESGRWYKFEKDGTFTNGHWGEQTGNGSWFLNYRDGKTYLMCDNLYNSQDVEWEIQGINQAQDAMSWVATTKGFTDSGGMVKIIQMLSRPSKEQFGYKE